MAVSQGAASSGSPGPPLEIRQKRYVSRKIRDRPLVGEVGRDRIQPVDEHAVGGHVVAMAEDAILVVDPAPILDVLAELFRMRHREFQEGVLSGVEIDLLVVDRDLGRRCRMDRPREQGRLQRDVHLDVDVRGRERRDGDDRCGEERGVPLLRHEPDQRAGDFFATLFAGGDVRQDRNRDDAHVERDDGGGNRRAESKSEDDVEPHPPGARPHEQIRSTEAKEREHGGHGEDDRDVHGVTGRRLRGGVGSPGRVASSPGRRLARGPPALRPGLCSRHDSSGA